MRPRGTEGRATERPDRDRRRIDRVTRIETVTTRPVAKHTLLAGGTGAIASCIFWFLGSAAMRDYEAASSSDAAVSARQAASQYSTLCSVSLAATGSGLATGGAALILTPDLDAIARDLDAGLQKLAELESEKERLK